MKRSMEVIPAGTTAELQPQVNNMSGATSDGHLISLWLNQKARRSKNTKRVYEHEVERFFDVVRKPLRAVTVLDMQRYMERLEGLGLAPATQARALSTIRSLFSFAQKTGYVQFNVTQVMELPKVHITTEFNFLTEAEAQKLLDTLRPNLRNYTIAALILKTGLRVSEVARINLGDIYQDASGNLGLQVIGKGQKVRKVKLTRDLMGLIEDYVEETGRIWLDVEAPLFLNRFSERLSTVSIWKVIREGAKEAGITKKVTPHTLRHSFATLAVVGGATLSQVQEACGHTDIRTTQRYEHSAKALTDTASDYVRLVV
ncbi:MAG: tyrosine-type recombinase/integrase [Bacillota bacterium]|jgi:integrase/recombinase XerD